ncbi:MAG: hypothetical protein MJ158_02760 [Alphaproteobacteria bacterium]|nr:hypothetical protein [Alphaproteobacteria bacterium]
MNEGIIRNLLSNSGINVINIDSDFIYIEDPGCIQAAFSTIFDYAWLVVVLLTGILIFGWGITKIFGIKNDLFSNAKNLILIFGCLSATKPAINVLYGSDIINKTCDEIPVSLIETQKLLAQRNATFSESDLLQTQEALMRQENINNTSTEQTTISSTTSSTTSSSTAYQNNGETIYTLANGEKIRRKGGSVAWRNNNPGNIRNTAFSREHLGAICSPNDTWATFASEEDGLNAVVALLKSKNYYNLSIAEAINRWAPSSDGNNPKKYATIVSNTTGLPVDTRISQMDDNDLYNVAKAIQKVEGWKPGTEERI